MKCCLIGKTLKHSYSKQIHNKLEDYSYDLVELLPSQLNSFVLKKEYSAYNVTIPFKSEIMQYLDVISDDAKKISAVNTVCNRNNVLYGFNTDFYGMCYALNSADFDLTDKKIMILGSGGTSKTAQVVCKSLKAKEIYVVSRNGENNYQNCYELSPDYIINTTPVGMYPNQFDSPIDLSRFNAVSGVFDVIYNPYKTKLCYQAEKLGVKYKSGLSMLVAQAKYASDLFLDKEVTIKANDEIIDNITKEIRQQTENLILIGMPGSGKSTLAKRLSERINKKFIDCDIEIEKKANLTIPEIFEKEGEKYFRDLESEVVKEVSLNQNCIIATGGGVVERGENHYPISCSGKVVFINRNIDSLALNGRPLSKDRQALEDIYNRRINLYKSIADYIVDIDGEVENIVERILKVCEY